MLTLDLMRDLFLAEALNPLLVKLSKNAKVSIKSKIELKYNEEKASFSEIVGHKFEICSNFITRVIIGIPFRGKYDFRSQSLTKDYMIDTGFSGFELIGKLAISDKCEAFVQYETMSYNSYSWSGKFKNW